MRARRPGLLLLLCLLLLLAPRLRAQADCQAESPLDDEAATAPVVTGGCVAGQVGDDDPQDLWRWSVDDGAQPWQFTLTGDAGTLVNLELLRVTYAADGQSVRQARSLYQFGGTTGSAEGLPLLLQPGDYVLGVAGAGPLAAYRLDIEPAEPLPAAVEAEPNDRPEAAQPLDGAASLSGAADNDWFRWTLSAAEATQRWQVTLQAPLEALISLTLYDAAENLLVPTDASHGEEGGRLVLHDLGLPPGDYLIRVSASGVWAGSPFALATAPDGERRPDREEEPNDLSRPAPFVSGLQGRLTDESGASRRDADVFAFTPGPDRDNLTFTISLSSESALSRQLCLATALGVEIQCREGSGGVALRQLVLPEESYLVLVDGRPDPEHLYTLTAEPGPPPGPHAEAEPNDSFPFATPLAAGNAARGAFDGREDDVFRLVTTGPTMLWRIQAIGDGIERLAVLDAAGRTAAVADEERPGLLRLSSVQLLPGTHYLSLRGDEGDYIVRALAQGAPDPNVEAEPNDLPAQALPLAFGQTRRGILDSRDVDAYRFRLRATEWVRLTVTPPEDGDVRLRLAGLTDAGQISGGGVGEPIVFEGPLLPDEYTALLNPWRGSDSAYAVRLERLNPFGPSTPTLSGVSMALQFPPTALAAYSPWSQVVTGTIRLSNESGQAQRLTLDRHTTIDGIETIPDSPVVLDPGESLGIPLVLELPPDLAADTSLVLTVRAAASDGRAAMAAHEWEPDREAEPAGASQRFTLGDDLLGAVDVASTGLGAVVATADPIIAAEQLALHNTHALDQADELFRLNSNRFALPQSLDVDLVGDEPWPIAAVALHPQGAAGSFPTGEQAAAFELWLSADGQRFERALAGTLEPRRVEQVFVLPDPVPATHARLVVRSSLQDGAHVVLDSWKVLVYAEEATPATLGRNLVDPALGGQLVRADLPGVLDSLPDLASRESMLTEDPRPWRISCREACGPLEWVIGFHEGRAAQIDSITWVDSPDLRANEAWPGAVVYASEASPFGPWTPLGDIDLSGGSPGEHRLDLATPVWARYLRFVVPLAPDTTYVQRPLPAVLRVRERATADAYRSILGEWGWESRQAVREWLAPPVYRALATGEDAADVAAGAAPLVAPVSDWVALGEDEDWFELTVPADQNTVELTLANEPAVDAAVELYDAAGAIVPLRQAEDGMSAGRRTYLAAVAPGETYRARVFEPPRSVVFAWDTSGSVAPFHPQVYQALARFAEGVTPGQEAVNLWPFGSGLILDSWQDDATLLLRGLQDYDRTTQSSATAASLLGIAEALAARQGRRAVILVGDMDLATEAPMALWRVLEAVQPSVYTLRVLATGPRGETAMRQWAAVRDGDAREAPTVSELELGFDRAAARLRRPAPYTLTAGFAFTAPPGPGTLRVVSQLVERENATEAATLGNTAVEIILDASGSMLADLGGRRRIDVARETLLNLTRETLPPGTPVALRAFGHIEGNTSCRTDLVVPLQPLEPEAMAAVIGRIEPKNLANTAIAASLRLAADDLADASGRRVILLLTDGEETCDGDPAAAIQELRDAGLDVRVNIVGFAIDDDALKAEFAAWADLGGGAYFDAGNAAELGAALNRALRAPVRVLNAAGDVVATGEVNGEGIVMAPGVYRVEVDAEPVLIFEEVVVPGDDETVLTVSAGSGQGGG